MNSYNSKGKFEIDYGTKLLNEILNKITKNTDEKIFIFQRFYEKPNKKKYYKGDELKEISIIELFIYSIVYNNSLDLEKKIVFYDLFIELNKNCLDLIEDKNIKKVYKFFKFDINKDIDDIMNFFNSDDDEMVKEIF